LFQKPNMYLCMNRYMKACKELAKTILSRSICSMLAQT